MKAGRVKGWTGAPVQSPWWAGWRLSVALLALVIIGGTTGYVVIEGSPYWHAYNKTNNTHTTAPNKSGRRRRHSPVCDA